MEELVKFPILRGGGGSSREMYTLQHLVTQYRGFIAGGYARWAMSPLQSPAPPSDIDCYFRDLDGMQAFSYAIARSGWRINRSSAFAVKFMKPYFDLPCHAVCVTGTPGFIVESMDFGICQAVIDHCEGRATYSYMDEESRRVLKIKNPTNLLLTLKRIEKYKGRGYTFAEEDLDYLFSFFAVRLIKPGVDPFAHYEILGVERAGVPGVTLTFDDSVGLAPLSLPFGPAVRNERDQEHPLPIPPGMLDATPYRPETTNNWDAALHRAPTLGSGSRLARTRGPITLEELAALPPPQPLLRRRSATEEEVAEARLERQWERIQREIEEDA